jgi:chemotaxis protein CheD
MIHSSQPHSDDRRKSTEYINVAEHYHGKRRFFSQPHNAYVVKIFAGDWVISQDPREMLATILGSCVSACVRDPALNIGGMNHFLLPSDPTNEVARDDAARYGVQAMELLINGLLMRGAQKSRLEFKVFGGGNVTNNSSRIGSKNAAFIRQFLRDEGYIITSEDLEGNLPRSLHYYPTNGRVMMRKLQRKEDMLVVEEEAKYQTRINQKPKSTGDVELF